MTPLARASQPPDFIKLLGNEVRWSVLKALATSDHRVNELVDMLQQPINLISYHLRKMRQESLVSTRRSEADGRDIYYSLNLTRLRHLFFEAGQALHPAMSMGLPAFDPARLLPQRVLFICTHNSARSQMAEGLLRHLSQGRLHVVSAGSQPTAIHSDAITVMDQLDIDIRGQEPRPIAAFIEQPFDYVITVCDKAREVCPTFPGGGQHLHWGFPDPAAISDDAARTEAFEQIALHLKSRITYFLTTLPVDESRA